MNFKAKVGRFPSVGRQVNISMKADIRLVFKSYILMKDNCRIAFTYKTDD